MSRVGSPLIEHTQSRDELVIRVRQRSTRYLDEFVTLLCAPDLLVHELYPNAKEITESMAAYHAARGKLHHLWRVGAPGRPSRVGEFALKNREVTVVVVGDGNTPRTAALFAYRSGWSCYSVDPRLPSGAKWAAIQRLEIIPAPIEEFRLTTRGPLVIVAVHSHANLATAAQNLRAAEGAPRVIIAIPCCVDQTLGPDQAVGLEYVDWGIWSPLRTVRLWLNDPALPNL